MFFTTILFNSTIPDRNPIQFCFRAKYQVSSPRLFLAFRNVCDFWLPSGPNCCVGSSECLLRDVVSVNRRFGTASPFFHQGVNESRGNDK